MPRLVDTDLRTRDLVVGVNRVLAAHGIPGLTMRLIARESGISTGSLMHHFGTRERILRIAAQRTGQAMIATAEAGSLWVGVEAFLPGDEEARWWTRAWVAWCELGRGRPPVGDVVAELRWRERAAIARPLDVDAGEPALELVVGVIDGLRAAACVPDAAISFERARELLRTSCASALGRSD